MASGLGSGSAEGSGSGSGSASAPSCPCFCIANSSAVVGVPSLWPLSSRLQSAPALINCGAYAVYKYVMYTAASAAVCATRMRPPPTPERTAPPPTHSSQLGAAHQADDVVMPPATRDHERRRRIRGGRGAVDVGAPLEQHASSSELVVEASEAQWRGVLMVEPVELGARTEQHLHYLPVGASVQSRPTHPREAAALRQGPSGRSRSRRESHLPLAITYST